MATKIDTVSSRDRLKPRREPYWHRLSKGCYLGFRKMVSNGHGNWIARAMHESRGQRRSDSTLNRDMTCFRAALNLAYLDGLLTTDFAWRSKLRPIKNADQRRELYLDRAQRLQFIEAAPAAHDAFLRGLCHLPLRPGALAGIGGSSCPK